MLFPGLANHDWLSAEAMRGKHIAATAIQIPLMSRDRSMDDAYLGTVCIRGYVSIS